MSITSKINYLAADGEERLAGGVHEDDLALISGDVIIDAKDEIALGVVDSEAIAVEQQGLCPYRQDDGGIA